MPKEQKYQTIKVLYTTYRLIKIVAAATGEQMLDIVERLFAAEAKRLKVVYKHRGEK